MEKIKVKWSSIYTCIALLCMMQSSYGQAVGTPYIPESRIPFSFLSGGNINEIPMAMDKTSDGGYVVIGASSSSANGDVTGTNHQLSGTNTDWWIVKYSSLGKIEWQKLYGGNGFEEGTSIKQTTDGGYIAAGYTTSSSTGDVGPAPGLGDWWVMKLSATGSIVWQKAYGGSNGPDWAKSVVETSDGYLVAGRAGSTNIPGIAGQYWVNKLDFSGNVVWQQSYADPLYTSGTEAMYSMAATGDGYILAGYAPNAVLDAFIMKIDLTGSTQWKKLYGGNQEDIAFAVSAISGGGSIVVGSTLSSANGDVSGTNHGGRDLWILRLDAAGGILWQQLYGGSGEDIGHSVQQTADGGFIVACYSTSSASGNVTGTSHGGIDVWILKLTSTGTIQWQKLYGGAGADDILPVGKTYTLSQPLKIMQTADGGYIVAAGSNSSVSGDVRDINNSTSTNTDYWLFKIDASGNIVWVPNVGQ